MIAFLSLNLSLLVHFFLKSTHKLNLLFECLFFIYAPLLLFLLQLAIPRLLFLLDLELLDLNLLFLSHTQQLDMLFLNFVIHAVLLSCLLYLISFLLKLFVKFLANQSLALLLTQHCLFLLFVVKQLVELLDSGPFIILCNFTVNLCQRRYPARSDGYVVIYSLGLGGTRLRLL